MLSVMPASPFTEHCREALASLDYGLVYDTPPFAPSFRAFRKQRAESLALLRRLPKAAWSRNATVTGAGKPRERTVLEYAQWLANHERSHVKHIARMID
jgi:hypothetical protein